jgi:hypothetical protein
MLSVLDSTNEMGGEARIAIREHNESRAMSPNARRCSDKIRRRLLKALIPEDRSERTMIRACGCRFRLTGLKKFGFRIGAARCRNSLRRNCAMSVCCVGLVAWT